MLCWLRDAVRTWAGDLDTNLSRRQSTALPPDHAVPLGSVRIKVNLRLGVFL